MIKYLLGIATGIALTGVFFYSAFEPTKMLDLAYQMANLGYRYGCAVEHGQDCESKADFYETKMRSYFEESVKELGSEGPDDGHQSRDQKGDRPSFNSI